MKEKLKGIFSKLKILVPKKTSELQIPKDVVYRSDVKFGQGGDRALKMDILHPRTLPNVPMPVLVWIHSGAFRGGSKREGLPQLLPFAQQGYFCATIEYRLSHEAIFPAQIEDCKCGIRYLRVHAKMFHLDPDRIGVWGSSAGGYLAALLGITHHVKEFEGKGGWEGFSSRVQAVCDWFGPTDFLRISDFPSQIDRNAANAPEALLIGGPLQENKEKVARANPITYLTKEASPFLIMHAEDDPLVPFNQSQLLVEALQQAGVEVTFEVIEGGKHDGKKFYSPDVLKKVENFFKKHLEP